MRSSSVKTSDLGVSLGLCSVRLEDRGCSGYNFTKKDLESKVNELNNPAAGEKGKFNIGAAGAIHASIEKGDLERGSGRGVHLLYSSVHECGGAVQVSMVLGGCCAIRRIILESGRLFIAARVGVRSPERAHSNDQP